MPNIINIGDVDVNYSDYTSHEMLDAFTGIMTDLGVCYTKPPSASNYQDIVTQIQLLKNLSLNGINVPTGEGESYTCYLSADMTDTVDELMKTLAFCSIPDSSLDSTEQADAVQLWQSLNTYGLDVPSMLTKARNLASTYKSSVVKTTNPKTNAPVYLNVSLSPTQTLQSMLEVNYIGTGNNFISSHLTSLETALTLSNSSLTTLGAIQNILNQVTVNAPPIPFNQQFPPNWEIPISQEDFDAIYSLVKTNSAFATSLYKTESGGFALNVFNPGHNFLNVLKVEDKPLYNLITSGFYYITEKSAITLMRNHTDIMQAALLDITKPNTYSNLYDYLINTPDHENFTGLQAYKSMYKMFASSFFSQIFPTDYSQQAFIDLAKELLADKSVLLKNYNAIVATNPAADTNAFSVASSIKEVIKDISTSFSGISMTDVGGLESAVKTWILDARNIAIGQAGSQKRGFVQNHLTEALTNSENLQEQQKQKVTEFMYIFQQFYKTSIAILNLLNQLLSNISHDIMK